MNKSQIIELIARKANVSKKIRLKDCTFYHTMDIPGYGTVKAHWDLRGREAEYLGNVPLRGRRVLEIGPASGCLSMFMEREGAEVLSLEADADHRWELQSIAADATVSGGRRQSAMGIGCAILPSLPVRRSTMAMPTAFLGHWASSTFP